MRTECGRSYSLSALKGKEQTVISTRELLLTGPGNIDLDVDALSRCIDECFNCAKVCIVCADADLAEDSVAHMRRCITLCGNCADICEATARVVSRTTEFDLETARALLEACITSCRICAEECEHHAKMGMKHCAACEEACRECEAACRALLSLL
jgi:hypothetical protein